MDAIQQEVHDIFIRTKALLQGHFVLRSGLHSAHYFQCAQVCQHLPEVERLAQLLLGKNHGASPFQTVLAPAMGGLVIGQEVARQARARYLFAEKENNVLVAAPRLQAGARRTRPRGRGRGDARGARAGVPRHHPAGGRRTGGHRDAGGSQRRPAKFDVPIFSLLEMSFPTYPADQLPEWLAQRPVEKPGS